MIALSVGAVVGLFITAVVMAYAFAKMCKLYYSVRKAVKK